MEAKSFIDGRKGKTKSDKEGIEILLRLACYKLVTQHITKINQEIGRGQTKSPPNN